MTGRKRALLELNLATLMFGFMGPLGKSISLTPLPITFWRATSAALFLFLIGRRIKGHSSIKSRKDLLTFLAIAVFIALQSILFFRSVQASTVAIAVITIYTYPILMVFLESWLFGGRIRLQDIGSAVMVLVGIFCITPERDFSNATFQGVVFGVLAGLTVPVIILTRRKFLVGRYTSWDITAYEFGFVGLILFPIMVFTKNFSPLPGPDNIVYLLFLGLFATGLGRMLLVKSQVHLSGKTVGLTITLEVLYGIAFALVLLSEIPTQREMLGGLIVLAVVLFETLRGRKEA
ncbi:MAG: EamA family transporter [Candidatus Latescibacteria bacterium]|nr:EamA family transporter [Candidatus Latescibacterota bacterium]